MAFYIKSIDLCVCVGGGGGVLINGTMNGAMLALF